MTPPVLTHFDDAAAILVHANASSSGIGVCVVQQHKGLQRIISYASRSPWNLSSTIPQQDRKAVLLFGPSLSFVHTSLVENSQLCPNTIPGTGSLVSNNPPVAWQAGHLHSKNTIPKLWTRVDGSIRKRNVFCEARHGCLFSFSSLP